MAQRAQYVVDNNNWPGSLGGGNPIALQWQTTPPTVQGWYFLKPKGEACITMRYVDQLNGIMVVVHEDDYSNVNGLTEYSERVDAWLGPLPEPEMPE